MQNVNKQSNHRPSQNSHAEAHAIYPFCRLPPCGQIATLSAKQSMNNQPIQNCERLYLKKRNMGINIHVQSSFIERRG
ncbi:hypothetical protein GR157_14175 [Burkholderia sp. 4701]|nr:hypothetical protein [Burkholderia sp. 4701]MXN82719.1 hypothetical protein [Burkholderia sp. 4812]